MTTRLFAYGTLVVPAVLEALIERRPSSRPARLEGFARFRVRGAAYPGIVETPGGGVEGVVYEPLDDEALAVLDVFEGELYERRVVEVRLADASVAAFTYVVPLRRRTQLSDEPWDLARFLRDELPAYLAAVRGSRANPEPDV